MICKPAGRRLISRAKNCFSLVAVFCSIGLLGLSGCGTLSKTKVMVPKELGLNECVILVHGLGRTYHSMRKMQKKLTQAGYHTVNLDYPSRKQNIEELAANHIPPVIEECTKFDSGKIHRNLQKQPFWLKHLLVPVTFILQVLDAVRQQD